MKELQIIIRASGAHAHLSQADLETLFGPGEKLNVVKMLGDGKAGQYLSDKKVEIICEKGSRMLSVLGPLRGESQIEVSYTEGRVLGVRPPIGDSGELEGTMGCTLAGPAGKVQLSRGLMVARRHLHLNVKDAEDTGLRDKDYIKVRVEGGRALVFDQVLVRVGKGSTVMHVDYDEMNAAGLTGTATGFAYKD